MKYRPPKLEGHAYRMTKLSYVKKEYTMEIELVEEVFMFIQMKNSKKMGHFTVFVFTTAICLFAIWVSVYSTSAFFSIKKYP